MKSDNTEAAKGKSNLKQIISSDLVAQSILTDIYSVLKDKERASSLSALEIDIISSIENNYLKKRNDDSERIKLIIEEAKSILNETSRWGKEHKDLYLTLEKIVFLGMKENDFSEYFQEVEKSVNAILQLEFSTKAPIYHLSDDKRNLFNYISIALNMIMEKLEISIISRKAINALLTSYPDSIVIVTDEKGYMRFVNNLGEHVLKSNLRDLIGTNIKDIIETYGDAIEKLHKDDALKTVRVIISTSQDKQQEYHLSLPEVTQHQSEVPELVHVLKNTSETSTNKQFDLKLDSNDDIVPLNLIIGAAKQLEESLFGNDSDMEWVRVINDTAWFLKEKVQGTLESLVQDLPEEFEPINFKAEIEEAISQVSNDIDKGRVNFDIHVPKGLNFLSSRALISKLLESCLANCFRFIGKRTSPKIEVEVVDRKDKGISILVKDNGIGIPKEMRGQVLKEDNMNTISQVVEKLKGTMELKSKVREGTTIRIDLPH